MSLAYEMVCYSTIIVSQGDVCSSTTLLRPRDIMFHLRELTRVWVSATVVSLQDCVTEPSSWACNNVRFCTIVVRLRDSALLYHRCKPTRLCVSPPSLSVLVARFSDSCGRPAPRVVVLFRRPSCSSAATDRTNTEHQGLAARATHQHKQLSAALFHTNNPKKQLLTFLLSLGTSLAIFY